MAEDRLWESSSSPSGPGCPVMNNKLMRILRLCVTQQEACHGSELRPATASAQSGKKEFGCKTSAFLPDNAEAQSGLQVELWAYDERVSTPTIHMLSLTPPQPLRYSPSYSYGLNNWHLPPYFTSRTCCPRNLLSQSATACPWSKASPFQSWQRTFSQFGSVVHLNGTWQESRIESTESYTLHRVCAIPTWIVGMSGALKLSTASASKCP